MSDAAFRLKVGGLVWVRPEAHEKYGGLCLLVSRIYEDELTGIIYLPDDDAVVLLLSLDDITLTPPDGRFPGDLP